MQSAFSNFWNLNHEPRVPRRMGFTLVEMLVVVAIIAIIATLSIGALMIAPQKARIRGTEALIAKLDARLSERLAEFNKGREDLLPNGFDLVLATGGTAPNLSRAKVIAVLRTMREEFPEMLSNLDARLGGGADTNGDGYLTKNEFQTAVGWNPANPTTQNPPLGLMAAGQVYWRNMANALASAPEPGHIRGITERAELLYQIITRGGSETGDFASDEIKDTDNDGLPEFVDKFGNPIQFFLWPSYYTSPRQNPGSETDPNDPQQFLTEAHNPPVPATDWWYNNASLPSPPYPSNTPARLYFESVAHTLTHFLPSSSNRWQPKGFRTYPLIISAGPDGGFGLRGVNRQIASIPALNYATGSAGEDRVFGTSDDRIPIGIMLSVGPDGTPETNDDDSPLVGGFPLFISPAMRITDPTIYGYGMDQDNIDNHHLRAR